MKLPEISVVLPCFNEEKAVQFCLDEIKKVIEKHGLNTEVIVVDNNSTDKSKFILEKNLPTFKELKVVHELNKGYGYTYLKGFAESKGKYIFMADCDGTYDFDEIPNFINELKKGSDLVVGNRFANPIGREAMPFSHRYIGNPLLSSLARVFFRLKIHDIHCGARAFKKDALSKVVLYTKGMEFASEMIIKFAKTGLVISELPISYYNRIGVSKLSTISDGWRHLKFLLIHSPLIFFLLPGLIFFVGGVFTLIAFYFFETKTDNNSLYIHPMLFSSIATIIGYELILFAGFARTYAITHLGDKPAFLEPLYSKITLEKMGAVGIILTLTGLVIYILIVSKLICPHFDSLNETKNSILALTLVGLGVQTFFSAFMFSILRIKEK
jgi:glycosyltransferase involved in cell wall biosynthesis